MIPCLQKISCDEIKIKISCDKTQISCEETVVLCEEIFCMRNIVLAV